jgi:hypothetical protein
VSKDTSAAVHPFFFELGHVPDPRPLTGQPRILTLQGQIQIRIGQNAVQPEFRISDFGSRKGTTRGGKFRISDPGFQKGNTMGGISDLRSWSSEGDNAGRVRGLSLLI